MDLNERAKHLGTLTNEQIDIALAYKGNLPDEDHKDIAKSIAMATSLTKDQALAAIDASMLIDDVVGKTGVSAKTAVQLLANANWNADEAIALMCNRNIVTRHVNVNPDQAILIGSKLHAVADEIIRKAHNVASGAAEEATAIIDEPILLNLHIVKPAPASDDGARQAGK